MEFYSSIVYFYPISPFGYCYSLSAFAAIMKQVLGLCLKKPHQETVIGRKDFPHQESAWMDLFMNGYLTFIDKIKETIENEAKSNQCKV